jgi:hypothetical protein
MCLGVGRLVVSPRSSGIFRRQSEVEVTCALDRKINSVVGLDSAISSLFYLLLSPLQVWFGLLGTLGLSIDVLT